MSPPLLTNRALNRATLARQGLLQPFGTDEVARLVERAGSLQAQHPDWPPLALATRLSADAEPVDLYQARVRRTVVRGSLMRMTVHIVRATDYWPMSTMTHPFRFDQWRSVFKADPLTSPLGRRIGKAHPAVLAAMADRPLAIHEIEAILRAELGPVELPANRVLWRHFSGTVPLIHVPYPEERYGRTRYLPAREWLGPPRPEDQEADRAGAHLARHYLAAFGPASVEDLVAYVGRGRHVGRWRSVVKDLSGELPEFVDEGGRNLVDLADAPRPDPETPAAPRLLARWDSLLLAYETKHRARVLLPKHQATVITKNADVLPTFLIDGVVAGTWLPRQDSTGAPALDLRPFGHLKASDREALEAEGARLLPLLGAGAYHRYPGTD